MTASAPPSAGPLADLLASLDELDRRAFLDRRTRSSIESLTAGHGKHVAIPVLRAALRALPVAGDAHLRELRNRALYALVRLTDEE